MKKVILITGGAGFIGSHVCRLFVNKYTDYKIVNLDALTYAGNLENLKDIEDKENYQFVHGDIRDADFLKDIFNIYQITDVIHLAAESHVDRSITNPIDFVTTNVIGTVNLLNVAKEFWKDDYSRHRFHHVSTDEVYGSLESTYPEPVQSKCPRRFENDIVHFRVGYGYEFFTEYTKYDPHSPYSASKASSDHFVKAYHDTYGLNITISNCSNNYGPNQFPEKLIPLVVNNLVNKKPIPVYGKGDNIRDWLYVEDHARAIDLIFHKGKSGETYNVGGNCEKTNLEIIDAIIKAFANLNQIKDIKEYNDTITFIEDRKGHDKRYAIDNLKICDELKWNPLMPFKVGIEETVKWYLENKEWLEHVTSGEYKEYYNKQYKNV